MKSYRATGLLLAQLLLWGVCASPCRADLDDADCIIEPHMVVEISTSVEGVVETITVDRGDVVEKDQILVTLESGVEKASVELARLRAREDAEILLGQARVEFEQRAKGRTDELFAKKSVSQHTKDEADYAASRAKLELRQARQSRKRAEHELLRAIEVLNRRTIRSPIDGIVVERVAAPGEGISEQDAILKLAQIDPLNVELIVPAAELGRLRTGMRLAVRLGQPVNDVYTAEVIIVDPVIDASSGTFGVRALLPNPDLRLPAGLACTAEIIAGEGQPAEAEADAAATEGGSTP